MSSLADPWRRLSPAGKVILPLVALFVTVVILVTIALMIRWIVGKLRLWWRPAPTPTP